MNETSKSVDHFRGQVLYAGIDGVTAAQLQILYKRAITEGNDPDWEGLYRGLFAARRSLPSPVPSFELPERLQMAPLPVKRRLWSSDISCPGAFGFAEGNIRCFATGFNQLTVIAQPILHAGSTGNISGKRSTGSLILANLLKSSDSFVFRP